MGKEDLKKENPTISDGQKLKAKIKEMVSKGISSQEEAKAYFDIIDVKPAETFRGVRVEGLYITSDGMPFYGDSDARNHVVKSSLKEKKIYFVKF